MHNEKKRNKNYFFPNVYITEWETSVDSFVQDAFLPFNVVEKCFYGRKCLSEARRVRISRKRMWREYDGNNAGVMNKSRSFSGRGSCRAVLYIYYPSVEKRNNIFRHVRKTVKTSKIVANLRNIIDVSDLFVSLFESNIFPVFIYQNKNKFFLVYLFVCFCTMP